MTTSNGADNKKIKQAVEILKFVLTIIDEREVVESSIESVIEMLEEEIDQK